ncbi:MAG: hypothetical protein M1837_006055 [Sclerophora amabilis]|nr:MAG: hypothetical protein M1837_006055 [Sclerophora amabilis]
MSDSQPSDADKIRNKRLAKLQNQTQAPAGPDSRSGGGETDSSPTSASPPKPAETSPTKIPSSRAQEEPKPKINISGPSAPDPAAPESQNPFLNLGKTATNGDARDIRISSAGSKHATPRKDEGVSPRDRHSRSPSSRASSAANPRPVPSVDTWEDKTLSGIFMITLKPDGSRDSNGNRLHYVQGVREDLEEQGGNLRISTDVLDQAILEAASNLDRSSPLDYLLGCWKRVSRQLRGMKSGNQDDPKYKIMKEAKRLCMSYCIFAATMPDMFGQEYPSSNPLTPHLLVDPESDRGICHDFLSEAVRRFDEDESIKDALVNAVEELSRQLAGKTMNDDYKPYVLALQNVARYPPLVNAITQSPSFVPPGVPAQDLEKSTLLGPLFQISPLQGEVTVNYFSNPKTIDKRLVVSSQGALRMTLRTHQTDILDIVNHIIRASKESRDRILDWFAMVVNKNHKRRALQVDNETVSSDGFMVNVTVCLDQLCEPFMDASFSKIDRIDVDYLRRNPRIDISEETKINADQSTSDDFYSRAVEGTSNFISEVYFLTLAAHHYGSEATITKLDQLDKDLKHVEKQLERIEADREKWVGTPQFPRFEEAVKRMKLQLEKGLSYKLAVQGVLYDDLSQARSMQFMRYAAVWLLRLASPHDSYPKQNLRLPLLEEQPAVVRCLPEYFLEDVVSNFKFIFRHLPHVVTSTQSDELVVLCITFLRSSEYIKNPYLKSGLVSILYHGIWPTYTRQKGILGDLLNSLPFATEHLLHALMKFYIGKFSLVAVASGHSNIRAEVENTGAHTQFYDKFNIRYEIFQVIKCIWSNPIYRERLSTEAKVNLDFFVRFVNLLLNDVTFVLDESLNAFIKIHNLQKELKSTSLEQAERTEKEELLATSEHQAKNYMQLTNETVAMLKLFTEALAESFTMPEIVQRLADMLDYNLDAMVGPKSSDLKVNEPEQYGFQPKILLSEIVDVYLNLRERSSFVDAVARDGRSYKPANFEKATLILSRHALKAPEELAAWKALGERFKKAKELDDQAEEDLGEIPDEFLDPLMFTFMEDPVVLPTSKVTMDRSTIRSHLLSDPNDPFNRAPLKIEDIVPDTDLKAKIEAFKAESKARKLAGAGAVDAAQAMDTTEG